MRAYISTEPRPERWYARGMQVLECELREQVLPDGGHFELSTMYQAGILEDLLDLVNLLIAYGREPPAPLGLRRRAHARVAQGDEPPGRWYRVLQ